MAKKQKSPAQVRHSEKWRVIGLRDNAQQLLETCDTLRIDEVRRLASAIEYLSSVVEDWEDWDAV